MPVKNDDFVLADYIIKSKDTGEVFDVTMADEAKAANVYLPDQTYEPRLVVVGQGWVLKGIDEALQGMNEGDEKDIEIPPQNAFGERDSTKVRIVPARDLTRQGVTPRPGARLEIGGSLATVRSVGSGRVTIDYNHPLAGRTLLAKIYLRKILSEMPDKIRELIHRRVRNVPKDRFLISTLGSMVTIEMPEEAFTAEDIQFAKKGLSKEISRYFPDVTSVQFIETYAVKPAAAKAPPAAKPGEAPAGGKASEGAEAKAEGAAAPAPKEEAEKGVKGTEKRGRPRKAQQQEQ